MRFATWDEFDLERGLWTIQPGRQFSKIPPTGRPHRVPLTDALIALLAALPKEQDNALVFWVQRGGQLSDAALAAVMREMHVADMKSGAQGFPDAQSDKTAVPLGLRSTFRTWVAERTQFDWDMAEIDLAHKVGSRVQ